MKGAAVITAVGADGHVIEAGAARPHLIRSVRSTTQRYVVAIQVSVGGSGVLTVYSRTSLPPSHGMANMRLLGLAPLALLASLSSALPASGDWVRGADETVFDAVTAGMSCKQTSRQVAVAAQTECTYRVGTGLVFQLIGVGEADVNIGVRKAGGYEDADFIFDFSMGHRCIVITAGNRSLRQSDSYLFPAFVSPRTGKVFTSWQQCARN